MLPLEALAHFESHAPDFVVLDIGLPDFTGFDVCRTIRQSSQVPILFLTARSSEIDQVLGLELGADDYVTKPFSPRAVVARVRAILRRGGSNSTATQHSDLLFHCCETMSIHCCNQPLDLTAYEYKILAILLEHPKRVETRFFFTSKGQFPPHTNTDLGPTQKLPEKHMASAGISF